MSRGCRVTRLRSLVCLAGLVLIGLVPAASSSATPVHLRDAQSPADAKTFAIKVDGQPPDSEPWAFNRFFPDNLQVHRGDVVQVSWDGTETPHTATAVPAADADQWRQDNQGPGGNYALVIPDSAKGGDDDELVLNPTVIAPSSPGCGDSSTPCDFDGSSVVNSGFFFSNPEAQPSFSVRVTAPVGNYSFLCLVHAGMEIPLSVVKDTKQVESPHQVAKKASQQLRQAIRVDGEKADSQAQSVSRSDIGNGGSRWTIWAGGFVNQVTANEFPDAGLTIHVGDELQILGQPEIHTATFPASSFDTVPFIKPQCEVPGPDIPAGSPADCADPSDFELALNNQAIFPSPSNQLTDPDAFVNSGLVSTPGSYTFVAVNPGMYSMVCLVHGPSMSTTVTVEP
jgi:plastocyanin